MSKSNPRPNRQRNKRQRFFLLICLVIILATLGYGGLTQLKVSKLPDPPADDLDYQVRGVDVSAYQGAIDWPTLASQGISFAFIKATEGSSHVDERFSYNWEEASKTNLRISAYHFMSFETSGEDQAKNFTQTVPKKKDMLPPVLDVELYGQFIKDHPSKETVYAIMDPLLKEMEKKYGMKPIIYTTNHMYMEYISGRYNNPIWIADSSISPKLLDGKKWAFCQYTFQGVLEGYDGEVKYIDLNVFSGSKSQFVRFK